MNMNFNMNFNMSMYGILYKTLNDKVKVAKEKLKNNQLSIDDVLKEQELVNSFKISTVCQLQDILTKQNLMKLIKNVITYPENNDYNNGYKFPFNSSEILATDNQKIIEAFFEDSKKADKSKYNFDKDDENEENIKIDKFYTNSEDKKLNIKKLEIVTETTTTNSKLNTNVEGTQKNAPLDSLSKDKPDSLLKLDIIEKLNEEIICDKIGKNEKILGETGNCDGNETLEQKDRYSEFARENNIQLDNLDSKVGKFELNINIQENINVEKKQEQQSEFNESLEANSNNEKIIENDNSTENILANSEMYLIDSDKEAKDQGTVKSEICKDETVENANSKVKQSILEDKIEEKLLEIKMEPTPLGLEDIDIKLDNNIETKMIANLIDSKENSKNIEEKIISNEKIINLSKINQDEEQNQTKISEFESYFSQSRYPLLDYLFSFIKSEDELDHVLCGYFGKIFINLFNNKTVHLVKYLFERPEIILSMVNHFNRISIIECLIKLIKYDTDTIILFERKSCDEVKEEVFKEIFDYIETRVFNNEEHPEAEILHCISEFFLECLEDKRTFIFFIKCPKFSLKLFETFLHPTLAKHIYVIGRYLEKVYIELTFKPNKQQENKPKGLSFRGEAMSNFSLEKEEDNSLECYYFLELFTSMIDYLFTRFKDESYGVYSYNDKEMDNTFGEKQKKLGLSKLYIMNLVSQILKHTFFVHENRFFNYEEDFFIEFYEKIINSDFFSIAVKYFFEFPWNNMYQNIFLDIINEIIIFSHFNKTLVEHVLYEIGFLEEIILCVVDEKYSCISKFQFKNNEIQNGFLTFIIEIAYNVKLNSFNNSVLQNIIDKSK